VNGSRECILIRDDDRARHHALAGLGVRPPIPQARETQHAAVRRADEIGLLAVRPGDPLKAGVRLAHLLDEAFNN
jgi:hypothetical protein